MNRFRRNKKEKVKEEVKETKKEAKKEAETPETPFAFISSFSKKKEAPEPEPQLDLGSVLPSNDDFRTSLLMPKLSARFSMLREQDNPDSLMGKASDDSVLAPKRASRLNMFGHNPSLLQDIDEVSIADGRPSFGGIGRTDSCASGEGYGTDGDRSPGGSIMSRARRAEGNNLFGGRQKIFKIPTKSGASSPNPEARSDTMGGRAVYDKDINLSAFQRYRLKEKEERVAVESMLDSSREFDALSTMSSANRTTYSSINSGPTGRASTAATSIDESVSPSLDNQAFSLKPPFNMPPERGSARSRRLYGQGLAQSVQNQQNSTLNRLESLSRQRAGTPELPPLNRTYSRSATNLRDRLQKLAIAEPGTTSRPTSPPSSATSPNQQTIESEPKESKPSPSQGAPPLSPPISENEGAPLAAALQPEDHGKATAMGLFNKPRAPFDESQFTRRQLQMHEGRNTPPLRRPSPPPGRATPQERSRGFSDASYRSRTDSASSRYSEAQRTAGHSIAPSVDGSPGKHTYGTFFANSSTSESGDDDRYSHDLSAHADGVHPALRDNSPSTHTVTEEPQNPLPEVRYSDLGDLKPIAETESQPNDTPAITEPIPEKPDSPTLGPSGLGLSGLVRTHLRSNSDRSSIFPPPSPAFPPKDMNRTDTNVEPTEPVEPVEPAQPTMDAHLPAPVEGNETSSSEEQGRSSDERSSEDYRDELLKFTHRREASSETQRERDDFAKELAERQRRIQEKLKGFAESESRSGSPIPGRQTPEIKPGNAFSLLKNKSGKGHLFHRPDQKGKVLGNANSSTPTLVSEDWQEEDDIPPFNLGKHSNTSSPQVVPEKSSMRSRLASATRGSHEGSRESSRSRPTSPHASFRRRDRSGSDASASGRSKSRNRYRERDDLGTLDETSAVSHETFAFPEFQDARGFTSVPGSTRPSVEISEGYFDRAPSAASGRYRSGSQSATPSYHDSLGPPRPAPSPMVSEPPRPSPIAPYSANATPPLHEISPEPTSTPAPTFAAAASHVVPQRAPGHHGLTKRLVTKAQISEPTFVSCTSNVPTVGLPPGASLSNGMETPPIPPMNPRRRRQTTTQTIISTLKGERHESYYSHTSDRTDRTTGEEQSSFEDDGNKRPKSRARLRKTSSEGGSLTAKARQELMASPPPGPPPNPPQTIPMDGGMF